MRRVTSLFANRPAKIIAKLGFNNSVGWILNGPINNHLFAPLTSADINKVPNIPIMAAINKHRAIGFKYLGFIYEKKKIIKKPGIKKIACFFTKYILVTPKRGAIPAEADDSTTKPIRPISTKPVKAYLSRLFHHSISGCELLVNLVLAIIVYITLLII